MTVPNHHQFLTKVMLVVLVVSVYFLLIQSEVELLQQLLVKVGRTMEERIMHLVSVVVLN